MKRLFLFSLLLCSSLQLYTQVSQVSIYNLYFNSDYNITTLDFNSTPPSVDYTGITNGFEGIAHAEDGNGNVLFYVNASGVYRPNNTQMPGSVGILANSSSAEMNVCLIPGETDKYYILYNAHTCSPLYYSIVDLSLAGGTGDVSSLNVQVAAGFFGEGMEVVRIPGTSNYWWVTYECEIGVKVFEINASGIQPGISGLSTNLGGTWYDVRGELDYHNGKLAIACAWCTETFTCDFDPTTGVTSNPITIPIPAYGVEFSPDASKLYLSRWYYEIPNLFQFDFFTNSVTNSYEINSNSYADVVISADYLGQIELGPDGKIYAIVHNYYQSSFGEIVVLENPDDLVVNFNTIITLNIIWHFNFYYHLM